MIIFWYKYRLCYLVLYRCFRWRYRRCRWMHTKCRMEGYIFAAKNPDACVGDESRINKVKRIFFFTAPKKKGFFFV